MLNTRNESSIIIQKEFRKKKKEITFHSQIFNISVTECRGRRGQIILTHIDLSRKLCVLAFCQEKTNPQFIWGLENNDFFLPFCVSLKRKKKKMQLYSVTIIYVYLVTHICPQNLCKAFVYGNIVAPCTVEYKWLRWMSASFALSKNFTHSSYLVT